MVLANGLATAATAVNDEVTFYVGGDINYGHWSYKTNLTTATLANLATFNIFPKLKKGTTAFDLVFGSKFSPYFGAEAGYEQFSKNHLFTSPGKAAARMQADNIYLDLLAYVPVRCKFNFVGALGLGRMRTKTTVYNYINNTNLPLLNNKNGARLGLGAMYNIDPCTAARLMVRYQKTGNNATLTKNFVSAGVGLTYTFL